MIGLVDDLQNRRMEALMVIRDLHIPYDYVEEEGFCRGCDQQFPCLTIQVLDDHRV